ncbi:MAG: DEAD/DEAH box helicase, partial [Streptococcaceae bacterium]|nr:DEAD/DEAH box helicase [Streptococcaceae bacterium]
QAYVYLKKLRGTIDVRIDFTYANTTFSTDKTKEIIPDQKLTIIRNEQEEAQIIHLLEEMNYRKTQNGFAKELPEESALYVFFQIELPKLRKLANIHLGKKLAALFLEAGKHQPMIEVQTSGSWLDIRFDVSGIESQDIDTVLNALSRNEQFVTLQTGVILSLESEEFKQTSQILNELRQNMKSKKGHIQLPKAQSFRIQEMLKAGGRTHFSDTFKTMTRDLNYPNEFNVAMPSIVQAQLRDYQMGGVKWLKMLSHYGFGGILADEMGLGKTLQTITYLASEKENWKGLAVIVAPASLTYNWLAEFEKFAPSLKVAVVSGGKDIRVDVLSQTQDIDVLVTSYASLRQDIEYYNKKEVGYLILDEAQMVKNASTKTSQALRGIKVEQKFALSGTPIENNLDELWSIFVLVLPGLFPSKQKFTTMDKKMIAKMIAPFILRREKKDVLQSLPEKMENNLYVELTEEQKTVYLAYLKQIQEEVSGMDKSAFSRNRISILAGLTRLRQICDDPHLFMDDYEGSSGKLEFVKDLLLAAKENNRRVLLFSQFTGMLSIIERELNELGLETFYLRGSTKAQDRLRMVNEFNEGAKDVFLISLKAGGTGLNLTGADTVILYDLWWNPAVEEQAAGRAHRIGQTKNVEVWRMIAQGTIEERMDQLQSEKRELFAQVISGNDKKASQLSEEDIRQILEIGIE